MFNKTEKLIPQTNDIGVSGKCPLCLYLWFYLLVYYGYIYGFISLSVSHSVHLHMV